VSRPREILPGQFYQITRRCTQRQFLLRPDDATNNAFIYCLGVAAQRHRIEVILPVAESNHHHTTVYDRYGTCPAFVEDFHKLVARSQNALLGRWENFWAAQEPCITRLLDRETVIAKLVYAATNPVKDGLVERVHHWPGVNGYTRLMAGRSLHATRPRHFFRNPGPMPESVTLELTIPDELGPRDQVLAELREAVEAVERAMADHRKHTGARVLGRRRILEQHWSESPSSVAPRRNLRPRFAGRLVARVVALLHYRAFLDRYDDARGRWLTGERALFPDGTYWLAKFAAVPVGPPL
jgi:hypothetical protein